MEDEGKAAVGRLRERLGKITAEIEQRNQGLEVPLCLPDAREDPQQHYHLMNLTPY